MSIVETIIEKLSGVDPVWLLVFLLAGSVLAVALPTVRSWIVRHKHWQRSMVAAQTALQEGRYIEAKKMFLALLKQAEKDFGPEDPKVASAIRHLAMVYHLQGRHTVAEPLLYRSLAIMEKADPENVETSEVLEQLAGLCQAQGRYAATELILQRSLAIRERALGPDHPDVVNVLEQMVMLYRKVGKKDEAEKLEARLKLFRNGTRNGSVRPVVEARARAQATPTYGHWRGDMLWEEIAASSRSRPKAHHAVKPTR